MKRSYHLTLFNNEYIREQIEIDFNTNKIVTVPKIKLSKQEFESVEQFNKKYQLFISTNNEIFVPYNNLQGNIIDIYVENETIIKKVNNILVMNFNEISDDEILASGFRNKEELVKDLETKINEYENENVKISENNLITAWYLI